jgi:hypothetical protein
MIFPVVALLPDILDVGFFLGRSILWAASFSLPDRGLSADGVPVPFLESLGVISESLVFAMLCWSRYNDFLRLHSTTTGKNQPMQSQRDAWMATVVCGQNAR